MRRSLLALLALAAAASTAAAPAATTATADAPAGATVEDGTFPVTVCGWARVVSPEKTCVTVHNPFDYLP